MARGRLASISGAVFCITKTMRYYYSVLKEEPDVLTVPDVIRLFRIGRNSVYVLIKEDKNGSIGQSKPTVQKRNGTSANITMLLNCKKYADYICVDAIGEIIEPNYVTGHFKVVLKENGLKPVRFHDLRHSCASLLLANGVPMKMIQDWLGHSDMGTTAT